MRIGKWVIGAGLAVGVFGASSAVRADTLVTLVGGNNAGEPAAATALFHFSANTLTLTLTNDVNGPNAAGSLLGGIQFTMQPVPVPGTTTVSSAAGNLISIASTGSAPTPYDLSNHTQAQIDAEWDNWTFTRVPNPEKFQVSGNDPLIIGYGNGGLATSTYDTVNSSLTGTQHQPYVQKTGTFTFTILGVTDQTKISAASFLFGTNYTSFAGDVTTVNNVTPVPAPTSPAGTLVVFGLLAGGNALRKHRIAA